MKLLLSWARDFVDITVPADEIADTMALRGFEVASIERLDGGDLPTAGDAVSWWPDGAAS